MRFVIAFMAFAVCALAGVRKNLSLKKRAEFLSEIVAMLRGFSTEIRLSSPALDELIRRENGQFAQSVKASDSRDIKTAWENACLAVPQKYEERELLSRFAKELAGCGADGAQSVIEAYIEKFSALEKNAADDYAKKGGAFAKIGALCGIAAAIIII